jgi:flagellar hook-associated protein FlgK
MRTSSFTKLLDILYDFSREHNAQEPSSEESRKALDKAMKDIEESLSMYDILNTRYCELNTQKISLESQEVYDIEEVNDLRSRLSELMYLMSFNK